MPARDDAVIVALLGGAFFFMLISGMILCTIGAIALLASRGDVDSAYAHIFFSIGIFVSVPGLLGLGVCRFVLARIESAQAID